MCHPVEEPGERVEDKHDSRHVLAVSIHHFSTFCLENTRVDHLSTGPVMKYKAAQCQRTYHLQEMDEDDDVAEVTPPPGPSSSARPPTTRRKTSPIWNHFDVSEDDSKYAICKHCNAKVS